jgi:transmembrane sensor
VHSLGKDIRNISADINIKDIDQFLRGLPNVAPVTVKDTAQYTLVKSR